MPRPNWFGFPGDELPPNVELLQLVVGKWVAQAVYVAAELGIADLLGDGARTSADVARACRTDDDATYRLMRALSNVGVLAELNDRTFALTDVGQFLRAGVPGEVVHRRLNRAARPQLVNVADHQVRLQRIRMIVIERGALLEPQVVAIAVVAIVLEHRHA